MAASIENEKVADIFDDLWKKYSYIDSTDEPCGSDKLQGTVKQAIERCEKLIQLVNDLHLFSDNEDIEEVASNELRFLLLPALLAYFTNKNMKEDRYENLKKCQVYYVDFLKLCKNYSVTKIAIPDLKKTEEPKSSAASSQKALENKRKQKIERYKEQKETEAKVKELYPLVQNEHVDDEVKRDYYTNLLKQWINTSLEDFDAIESELPILEHMAKMKKSGQPEKKEPSQNNTQQSRQPMRPFIITKNDLQKQVFGLGYPSLPTYTLDEFYERQVQKGELPEQGHQTIGASNDPDAERKEQEAKDKEKEENIENDDEETLKKAREWDEWRDDHRRGWGNTDNKG